MREFFEVRFQPFRHGIKALGSQHPRNVILRESSFTGHVPNDCRASLARQWI
jgi:hypothetical protein